MSISSFRSNRKDCLDFSDGYRITTTITHQSDKDSKYQGMGSMRYGTRVGSISPPPPGVGPFYRSQCCWPNNLGDIPNDTSWTSTLPNPSINNFDIVSYANKLKLEKATSDFTRQATVRDQFLYNNKFLSKDKLRRCALIQPKVLDRFNNYDNGDILNNLDRLPRFRFGGNRANHKTREFDKETNDIRFKDVNERLRRSPAVPPRTKRNTFSLKPSSIQIDESTKSSRPTPSRSASFSQVEYLPDGKRYIRKNEEPPTSPEVNYLYQRCIATFPRSKNTFQSEGTDKQKQHLNNNAQCLTRKNIENESPPHKSTDSLENSQKFNEFNEINTGSSRVLAVDSSEDKKFKSKRRKGVYLSQWSAFGDNSNAIIPQFVADGDFNFLDHSNNINTSSDIKNTTMDNKLNDLSSWSNSEEPLSPDENNTPPEWLSDGRYRIHPKYLTESTNSIEPHSRETSLQKLDSLSEDEHESERKSDRQNISSPHSDISDIDRKMIPKRYTKRPLRGPYGQMLEAEMKKPEIGIKNNYDLNFLNETNSATRSSSMKLDNEFKPKHSKRESSSKSYDEKQLKDCYNQLNDQHQNTIQIQPKRKVSADNNYILNKSQLVNHQRTISSPSKFENLNNPVISNKLLNQLLQGSSEQLAILSTKEKLLNDTRTHVVVELYDNERNYVESLQILITKYLEPLKSQENSTILDSSLVDEVFNQIPFLLTYHQHFMGELKKRLDEWDVRQKIGDTILEFLTKPEIIDSYTSYVNNWERARNIIKTTKQTKPLFTKFLENTAKEYRGKLALDSLLIKPIQRFPRYELLIQRLLKHTDVNHTDHRLLLLSQKVLHEHTMKINCTERENLELELLRDIEGLIDGLINLVSIDRQYIRHDIVCMTGGVPTRKERGLLLFTDLLLITSVKRKSGAIKKPIPTCDKAGITIALEANKYKLLMKISLEDLEITKPKDENVRHMIAEMENLNEDLNVLNQINELSSSLHCNHNHLDELVKEMIVSVNKHLSEQQSCESQLSYLDLNLNTPNGIEHISLLFPSPEKRASWEETFTETKLKLVTVGTKKNVPELVATVPIRKTRAGLQFTCAAATLGDPNKNVWVCNSDGYVGQVCVLSLQPEPTVSSCNGICNARILCIVCVPANNNRMPSPMPKNIHTTQQVKHKIQFDSSSSSEDDERSDHEDYQEASVQSTNTNDSFNADLDDTDYSKPTMWLGTEDGCIHIYNSTDNIRTKKNKVKIQHNSSIVAIIYMDNRVFVSLGNGDIMIYDRDAAGVWSMNTPITIQIGTISNPVLKLISNDGKLWCNYGNSIKILNTRTLGVENVFQINTENNKPISCLVISGTNVWISVKNSAIVKCYNATNFELICEVNVAPAVTKMLTGCDDIIRQHKAACLRVTTLLACKDLIWVGTSAGVLLTIPITSNLNPNSSPIVTGVSHGHTGHARFITHIELTLNHNETQHRSFIKRISDQRGNVKSLVISGGDGYEDFRGSNSSEVAGREDSTNHLLLWSV